MGNPKTLDGNPARLPPNGFVAGFKRRLFTGLAPTIRVNF
jgi:hypothetical protein